MLPGRGLARQEYTLGATWSRRTTSVATTDHGITAALLTNLTVNALRNARRAGVSLEEQAYLADQAV
ncbi:hypothetical protein [Streptomyces lavendofoliae]|uniref:Uncharacterized protein n=1 Tax=Streptomyces lavendofoliae TaxID=67314 RepID=A0A918I422_9ACTN|nr:hypothetical protein [Streptomyces lavendofoliae]GGU63254.1 hypothetical protein GCM10010274_59970 [Streptomyces lavendofoliae]